MKKEDLLCFEYGDQILIAYKNRFSNDPRMPLPPLYQDLCFFLEVDGAYLEGARHNPALVGDLKSLPNRTDFINDPAVKDSRIQKRYLLLDTMMYYLDDIIHVRKVT